MHGALEYDCLVNLLLIEIGNTSVKVAVFEGDQRRGRWSLGDRQILADNDAAALRAVLRDATAALGRLDGVAVGSVVPHLTDILAGAAAAATGLEPMIVTSASMAEVMPVAVERPDRVGTDRLLNALAAFDRIGGPAIAVDIGTATTFDVVAHDGTYLGGAIAPGPRIAAEALHTATALLPQVELERPERAIGTTTETAMQSGLVNGYIGLVSGLLAALRSELAERVPKGARIGVVATGGYAAAPWLRGLPGIDAVDEDLTLRGLRLAHARLSSRPAAVAS